MKTLIIIIIIIFLCMISSSIGGAIYYNMNKPQYYYCEYTTKLNENLCNFMVITNDKVKLNGGVITGTWNKTTGTVLFNGFWSGINTKLVKNDKNGLSMIMYMNATSDPITKNYIQFVPDSHIIGSWTDGKDYKINFNNDMTISGTFNGKPADNNMRYTPNAIYINDQQVGSFVVNNDIMTLNIPIKISALVKVTKVKTVTLKRS